MNPAVSTPLAIAKHHWMITLKILMSATTRKNFPFQLRRSHSLSDRQPRRGCPVLRIHLSSTELDTEDGSRDNSYDRDQPLLSQYPRQAATRLRCRKSRRIPYYASARKRNRTRPSPSWNQNSTLYLPMPIR